MWHMPRKQWGSVSTAIICHELAVAVWLNSNGVGQVNEVTLHRARLLMGWVTFCKHRIWPGIMTSNASQLSLATSQWMGEWILTVTTPGVLLPHPSTLKGFIFFFFCCICNKGTCVNWPIILPRLPIDATEMLRPPPCSCMALSASWCSLSSSKQSMPPITLVVWLQTQHSSIHSFIHSFIHSHHQHSKPARTFE